MSTTFCYSDAEFTSLTAALAVMPDVRQEARIKTALGIGGQRAVPQVDEKTHARYFAYLAANLAMPFEAHHPLPSNPQEQREFRCQVLDILDPRTEQDDEFDGILCMVRKEDSASVLPLIELAVSPRSRNFQLIEDYWYWIWNWR